MRHNGVVIRSAQDDDQRQKGQELFACQCGKVALESSRQMNQLFVRARAGSLPLQFGYCEAIGRLLKVGTVPGKIGGEPEINDGIATCHWN